MQSHFFFAISLVYILINSVISLTTLSDGQYFNFQLSSTNNPARFSFQHPGNPAEYTAGTNSFTVLFDTNISLDSRMSLQLSRDSRQLYSSGDIKPLANNTFSFVFSEVGGGLSLTLSANSPLINANLTCNVVFNIQPVFIKRSSFTDTGNFLYTKQYFAGTYSNLRLYNAYQVNVEQSGYLILKKYDCIGHAEVDLTKQFTSEPKSKALTYQNLVTPPAGDSYKNFSKYLSLVISNHIIEPSERVYKVDKGIYYIILYPGYGLTLAFNDGARAFYKLDVQLWTRNPTNLIIPSLAINNLGSVRVNEEKGDNPKLTVVFDSIEKGLPATLSYDISYTIVAGMGSVVGDYYSRCGVDAPQFDPKLLMGNQKEGFEYEVKQGNGLDESQKIEYRLEKVSLSESDVGVGVDVLLSLQTDAGVVSARLYYNTVDLTKYFKEEFDVAIIIVIGKK